MTGPSFGLVLAVRIFLLPTAAGGRSGPIGTGYRPHCLFPGPDGIDVRVGLCELQLLDWLAPGDSAEGSLSFDVAVSNLVRSLIEVGSRFAVAEGITEVGSAEVVAIEP